MCIRPRYTPRWLLPARDGGKLADMDMPELMRRLDNMIRLGTVEEIDASARPAPLVRVLSGRLLTGWIPYFLIAAGADHDGYAPSIGEGCVVFSPAGDPAQGFALCGLPTDQFPAAAFDQAKRVRQYRDGALVQYDSDTHHLTATLPAGGRVTITSPAGFQLIGDVDVDGTVRATQDVVAAGVSLVSHPTSGVRAGGDQSGPPVATS